MTSYFIQSFVVNIDSDDVYKAGYKADILSTQQPFHDDCFSEARCTRSEFNLHGNGHERSFN